MYTYMRKNASRLFAKQEGQNWVIFEREVLRLLHDSDP